MVMLVKGGSAGLDGSVDGGDDGRQERDLGDERVAEGRWSLRRKWPCVMR